MTLQTQSNVWLQLHYQKRGCTAKEYRPEEEENHIMNPGYTYFLANYRPVAKKIENYIEIEDDDEDDDSVIPDPEYELFLKHLKPDGESYALEIVEANVYVKYEPSIESANDGCNHVPSEEQNHAGVKNRDVNYKGKRRGRKPKARPELHDTKKNGDNRNKVKKNVVSSVEGRKIGEGVKKESDDDVYQIRRPVHCPVLNERFLCEDNDEVNARKRTQYRKKLMDKLKKPYCQEEYERLFKDITIRKHAQGHIVLRGRTISYDKDHVSKSYLDCHIDLKRKMNANPGDYPKVLNLMRGFFYWLVNISHEGVFRPWRVQSYLDELLQH